MEHSEESWRMNHSDQAQQQEQTARQGGLGTPATILVGSHEGAVALLATRDGATIWRASTRREVGELAHDGAQCYIPLGSDLRLIRPSVRARETPEQRARRFAHLEADPAWLEARGAQDGRLLWRRTDWNLIGRLDVGAEAGGAVVVVGSTSMYGDHALYGLDALTGATRWTYPATSQMQINGRRFALRGGRVYCYGEDGANGVGVLDAATGQPIWERAGPLHLAFSPNGRMVIEQRDREGEKATVRLLDAATGSVRQELALDGYVRAISDTGVAYLSTRGYDNPGLAATRLADGRELWRADDVLIYHVAADDATVCCAHITPERVGEVEALAADSGRLRWRWRTPEDARGLLRLWGARIPEIAAVSGVSAGKAVVGALADDLMRFPQRGTGAALWREITAGQWRRPYALHEPTNAMWLAANAHTAYLGTRIGVFALRADDGRLLWHALPTTDVSYLSPALSLS